MFTKLLDIFGESALKRSETGVYGGLKLRKEERKAIVLFLVFFHTLPYTHTHRVLNIYIYVAKKAFRTLIPGGWPGWLFLLPFEERRRDATARDIQKGTRHPSTKIRKSNIQNEYGVAGASRVARGHRPEKKTIAYVIANYRLLSYTRGPSAWRMRDERSMATPRHFPLGKVRGGELISNLYH